MGPSDFERMICIEVPGRNRSCSATDRIARMLLADFSRRSERVLYPRFH